MGFFRRHSGDEGANVGSETGESPVDVGRTVREILEPNLQPLDGIHSPGT